MSLVLNFEIALEACQKDTKKLSLEYPWIGKERTTLALTTHLQSLLENCKLHARSLLEAGNEIAAYMRGRGALFEPSLNIYDLSYYFDNSDSLEWAVSARARLLDKALKEFLAVKPYLKAEGEERAPAHEPREFSKKIFVVHGKQESSKDALKRMLQEWGLEPVVLAEQANRGRVLLNKLLDHTSDVGFAFVIMTVDDMGMPIPDYERLRKILQKSDDPQRWVNEIADQVKGMKARVRQNVLFEYGLCIGSLGPERVCVLVHKVEGAELEIPSDVLGHGYIPFEDDLSKCKEQIAKELTAAGYRPST